MKIEKDIEQIMHSAHFWNWSPDWDILQKVYREYPNSYSLLTPFAYAYLEELIRSMTTEYGQGGFDDSGNPRKFVVGKRLVKLAIDENEEHNPELITLLENVMKYFSNSKPSDIGENRNSVAHGYKHPRFWDKESFETLIHDIAILSPHAGF